ncbi:hypothetical protein EGW08_014507, partial [Elysia chlorotica]
RTEHAPKDRNVAETDPKRFAELLVERLTKVVEERESSAKVEEKLRSISEVTHNSSSSAAHNTSTAHNTSASFIPLMRPPDEETAESILDQHCMRIWASSHHTPSYSPPGGHHSPPPLPGKADARKKLIAAVAAANTSSTSTNSFTGGVIGQPLPFGSSPRSYHHKKRGASAGAAEFLAQSSSQPFDSGILEDRNLILLGTETHRHIHHHHHHHHSSGGSKKGTSALVDVDASGHSWRTSSSAPDAAQTQSLSSDISMLEYAGRGRSSTRKSGVGGGGSGGGLSNSALRNKSLDTSSNIDSGISVMFDKDSVRVPANWNSDPANENSNMGNLGSDRLQLASWASGGPGPHPASVMPSQPFAQDPSMPLLTPPNPTTQLEEAKRRLENQQQHQHPGLSFTGVPYKEKMRLPPSGTPLPPPHSRTLPAARTVPTDLDTSGVSQTLDGRLGRRVPTSSAPTSVQAGQGDTIIGIYMGQEPIPYRHQLSGRTITLAQIRTLVTKRGPFKYYFKRHSDEFGDGAGAVFEEISDESAVVPMFQGKIVVKVEKLDS